MNDITSWQAALVSSWAQVWSSFLRIIPQVLGAILVFAIGLVIAFWLKKLIADILRIVKFESLSKSLGTDQFLKKAGIRMDFTEMIAVFFQWLIILVFFLAATDILSH